MQSTGIALCIDGIFGYKPFRFCKKKIPELTKIFEGIKDQRYNLEIVGILKVPGSSEDDITLAVSVKSDKPSTSIPKVTKSPPSST